MNEDSEPRTPVDDVMAEANDAMASAAADRAEALRTVAISHCAVQAALAARRAITVCSQDMDGLPPIPSMMLMGLLQQAYANAWQLAINLHDFSGTSG